MKKLFGMISILFIAIVMSINTGTVSAQEISKEGEGGGGCSFSQTCGAKICSVLNGRKRFLGNGCKLECNSTCTVRGGLDLSGLPSLL